MGSGRGEKVDPEVRAYLDAVPGARRARVEQLHALILECLPQAVVDMRYRMPTYSVGEGWVAVANQKHYVSLYTCGAGHLVRFKREHPDIRTGRGCINFRDRDKMPEDAVRQVIEHAVRHPKGPPA